MKNFTNSIPDKNRDFTSLNFHLPFYILHFLLICTSISAQTPSVSTYKFTNSSAMYIPTLLGTKLTGTTWDEQYYKNQDIGFAFFYRGQLFTKMTVYCNGYIMLGNNVDTASTTTPLSKPNAISVFGANLQNSNSSSSYIKITTSGLPGYRICTIQYTNFAKSGTQSSYGKAQIKLYEQDGKINFSYGGFTGAFPSSSVQVGVSGTSDYKNLKGTNWTNPSAGTSITDVLTTTGSQPDTTLPDSSRLYTFSPDNSLLATTPTNLTFTNVGLQSATVNWTDNSNNEYTFAVYGSSDSIFYNYVGMITSSSVSTTGTNYSLSVTGLDPGTKYYVRVYALSDGGFGVPLIGTQSTAQPSFPTAANVPSSAFPTLKAALDSINLEGLKGNTVISLLSNYVSSNEPSFPITIPILPGSNDYTLTIRPDASATNLSITSSATQTIKLSGCKNIIFDGRAGGTGTTKNLSISNTSTSGNAIQFIEGASKNIFGYVTISGVNTSATSGVVEFSTSSTTTGNNNNQIAFCDIRDGASTPTNLIYCTGASVALNMNNNINNNNLYNFWSNSQDATGILIKDNNTNYIIQKNSFYQTTARTTATAKTLLTAILINNTTNGLIFYIDSNFIGGTAPQAGGTALILGPSSTNVHQFQGIKISNVGYYVPLTYIRQNKITNIQVNSTPSIAALPGTIFSGIELAVGCAMITDNIIGSETVTTSIQLKSASTTGATIEGIRYSGDLDAVGVVSNNKIGGIEIQSSSVGHYFFGITMTNGFNTIAYNTIGSKTLANSIYNKSSSNLLPTYNYGIYVFFGSNTVSFNTIANISSDDVSSYSTMAGIKTEVTATTLSVDHNEIFNLISKSSSAGTIPALTGIQVDNSVLPMTVLSNKIYNLTANNVTAGTRVSGILASSSMKLDLSQNVIHSLQNTSSSANASIVGIANSSDSTVCKNTVIRLGLKFDGTSITQGKTTIYGIYDNNPSSTKYNAYYFNTVYIGGSGVTTGTANSAAFFRNTSSADSVKLKNNIFVNGRSNATGTGKHYAVLTNNNTNWISNYNIYNVTGTGGKLFGKTDATATDYTTLSTWQGYAAGQDAKSLVGDPSFQNKDAVYDTAANTNLKLLAGTIADTAGVMITPDTVYADFENDLRNDLTPTDIGADAGVFSCNNFIAKISSLKDTACTGDSIILTANVGTDFTYQWLLNNAVINGATKVTYKAAVSGNYSVIVTTDISCIDTATAKNIVFNTSPTATITANSSTTICKGSNVKLSANQGSGLTYKWQLNSLTIPMATDSTYKASYDGLFSVKITNSAGCKTESDTIRVTINELPTATITAGGATTFCAGDSVKLTASTGTSYLWSNGATTSFIYAKTAASYTVKVTGSNGCSATSSATTVTVNSLPAKPTLTQSGDTLFSSAASTYQWSLDGSPINGATANSYLISKTGSYKVTITDAKGCKNTSDSMYMVITEIQNSKFKIQKFQIYPNPFSDKTTISYSLTHQSPITIEVFNILGKRITTLIDANQNAGDYKAEFSAKELGYAEGVYFVRMKTDKEVKTMKMIEIK